MTPAQKGRAGEDLAAALLEQKGYRILPFKLPSRIGGHRGKTANEGV